MAKRMIARQTRCFGRINPLQWPTVREYRANIETNRGIRDIEIKLGEGGLVPYLHVAKGQLNTVLRRAGNLCAD